eukprot:Skav202792  [mRNA]  locus=scaffold326:625565:630055:- [translate_table: standard]
MFHGFDVLPQPRLVLEDLRHTAVVGALPALVLLGLGDLGLQLADLDQDLSHIRSQAIWVAGYGGFVGGPRAVPLFPVQQLLLRDVLRFQELVQHGRQTQSSQRSVQDLDGLLVQDLVLSQLLGATVEEASDADLVQRDAFLVVRLFRDLEAKISFRIHRKAESSPACGLFDAMLRGGDGKSTAIGAGRVLDVQTRRCLRSVVLDGVARRHLVAMIQDTLGQMSMFIHLHPELKDLILLQAARL